MQLLKQMITCLYTSTNRIGKLKVTPVFLPNFSKPCTDMKDAWKSASHKLANMGTPRQIAKIDATA